MAQIDYVPAHHLAGSHRIWDSVQAYTVADVKATSVLNLADVDEKTLVGLVSFAKTEALGAVGCNNAGHTLTLKSYYPASLPLLDERVAFATQN
jgi:hypothetical protein